MRDDRRRPRVIVTCGEQRSALAIVRSLGRAGAEVHVCASRRPSIAGVSRWCIGERDVPDCVTDPAGFADALDRLIGRLRPDVVIPVTEAALLGSLPLAGQHPDTVFPFPDVSRFAAVCDKSRVFEVARDIGLRVPDEVVIHRPGDRPEVHREVAFPVVLKPARSVSGRGVRSKHGVVHAADAPDLTRALGEMPDEAYPLHVQKRIVGPGVGVFLLNWGGRRIAAFSHRRLREKPPSGGVSVLRESIPVDPALLDLSERLLARFDWEGVAMVEFKIDEATGDPFLMEINGRFWGSLELAVASGVDFPRLLVEAATGQTVSPVSGYRTDVRSRWLWGDVDHLLARLRHSPESLALSPDAPGRTRVMRDFLMSFFSSRPEVFRLSDLAPAIRESVIWITGLSRARPPR